MAEKQIDMASDILITLVKFVITSPIQNLLLECAAYVTTFLDELLEFKWYV